MKTIFTSLFLIFLLWPVNGKAQFSYEISGGLATYGMTDLKAINSLQTNALPFETVEVAGFDPGSFLNLGFHFRFNEDFQLGMVYRYNSTGSRFGQKDYSGYYAFDQILSCHFLGIEPETILTGKKHIGVTLSLPAGLNSTTWEMTQVLTVQGLKNEENQSLVSNSLNFTPSLNIYVPVFSIFSLKISAGYLIDTGGKLHVKGYPDAVLTIKNEPVKTGWSGFRIGAGLVLGKHGI